MAKAELDILLDKLSGRLTGDSKFYATNRYGKTVISNYPKHKNPKSITANQKANSSSFAQISKQAKQELADPARRAYWQQRYDEYKSTAKPADKYYFTLRGFVIWQLATNNKETN